MKNIISISQNKKEIVFIVLLLIPFLLYLFINHFEYNSDIMIQIEAAKNLSNGKGYVTDWGGTVDLEYLSQWPIGFSAIIAALLKIGFPLQYALKVYIAFFSIVGLFAWYFVSTNYFRYSLDRIALILIQSMFLYKETSYIPTELTLWAIFGVISWMVLKIDHSKKKLNKQFFIISIIISLLPVFKYVGIAIIPICFIWLIITNDNHNLFWRNSLILLSSPIIIISIIFLTNFYYQNSLLPSYGLKISNYNSIIQLMNLKYIITVIFPSMIIAIHAFLFENFYIFYFFREVTQNILGYFNYETSFPIVSVALSFSFLLFGIFKIKEMINIHKYNRFIKWMISSAIGIYSFLFVSTFFFSHYRDSVPVLPQFVENRYYQWIFPIILIFIFILIQDYFESSIRIKNIILYIILFMGLFSILIYVFNLMGFGWILKPE